ncbi:major capsid protein [Sneathiella sp.]|uniref:major capsid protein n=1 Tax=Sneathiella sp. TaxID=1964365 RepID=UPI002FE180B4
MAGMDIFNDDAFSMFELTAAINHAPFAPSLLRDMGLFRAQGVMTTHVAIEENHGTLTVVPTSERGSPPTNSENASRKMRNFNIPHLSRAARLRADEIQGVRAFGSLSELEAMETLVNQRIAQKTQEMDLTEERMMLAAIKGILVDADDSTIYNYYTEFGVTAPSAVSFGFAAITQENADSAVIQKKCMGVKRSMKKALGGMSTSAMSIYALCGDNFFDALIGNAETRAPYKNWQAAQQLMDQNLAYETFKYGGVTFINYQGDDDGVAEIGTDECRFFARNVPGLFDIYYAPADTFEFANTLGLPRYVLPFRDPRDKFWEAEVQSNPLAICTRPKSLIKGTKA